MKKYSINTMKPLSILAILFLVIAVSHANTNTNSDYNNQDESSSSSNLGHNNNPLIRLPTHTSDLDLTQLLNRHRVNLRNRYRLPLTRYVPRRCRHRFTTFSPGVRVDPTDDLATIMKKQAEFIRHRHVAGKFEPIKRDAVYEVKGEYVGEWKAGRPHHHHDDDHSDDEGDNKVHGHEVYAHHRFNHHGHKKKGNYIMRKIRKFLSYF